MFGRRDYYIVWSYDSCSGVRHTEIVRASSLGAAWRKVCKKHYLPIYMREGRPLSLERKRYEA